MEYKLGEIIEYKGDFLRIKLSESSENACTGCYFRSGNTCTCDYSKVGFCTASNRTDDNNVIFSRIVRREPKQGDIVGYKNKEYLVEEVPESGCCAECAFQHLNDCIEDPDFDFIAGACCDRSDHKSIIFKRI